VASNLVEYCQRADLPELFAQFADWYKFNPRMREPDFFDWQFRNPPTRLSDCEYDFFILRNDRGRIIGCLGAVGFEFRVGDRIDIGGWTHNWYAQGHGDGGLALLGRFMELVDNRFLIRLNEMSGRILQLLRVPSLAAIPRWWATIDADRVTELFGVNDEADRAVLTRSAALFRRNQASDVVAHVARLDPDEEFLFGHLDGITGHARRSGRYLNWRYVDIPKHNYRMLRTEQGVGVYRIETVMGTDADVLRILEWTFDAKETGAALATIMREGRAHNLILIDFHCTCRAVGAPLEPFGFVAQSATKFSMPDLFRPTYRSGGYAVAIDLPPHRTHRTIDFDSWYITIGDSDVDRVKL
jgi:hypothetical protein